MASSDAFILALKEARLAQAARLDAITNVYDTRSLRLQALRDALVADIGSASEENPLFDLSIQQGDTPRLWLDLHSSVEMEPHPKTYRLISRNGNRKETVFETQDIAEMHDQVLRLLAQNVVAAGYCPTPARLLVPHGAAKTKSVFGVWALATFWLCGLLMGVLAFAAFAYAQGFLKIEIGDGASRNVQAPVAIGW